MVPTCSVSALAVTMPYSGLWLSDGIGTIVLKAWHLPNLVEPYEPRTLSVGSVGRSILTSG